MIVLRPGTVADHEPAVRVWRASDSARRGGPAPDDHEERVPGLCHLSLVFVVPQRWGEGVGTRLVAAALAQALSLKYARIQLWTHEDNRRARALYSGQGFRHSCRTKDDDLGEAIGLWVRDL